MFSFGKPKVNTDDAVIEELLTRGTEDIFVKDHLKAALLSGKQLRIKLGIDPTSPNIHLGRTIPLLKLRSFQDLGHQVVLIIGDFTAKIADPSDKLEKRPMLSDEAIQKNLKDYLKQIGKVIDIKKVEIHYNSKWFKHMGLFEIGELLENFTVQQMSKRRNFQERLENDKDVFVVEFMYPALQGYDSFKVDSDVEIGGFDQLFNLKAGRTVQKRYGQREQDVMTLSMLEGTDGRKMSSSWGNVISLLDSKEDMFGKIMSVNDDLVIKYFTLCTTLPLKDIAKFEEDLRVGVNPKEIKLKLAKEIVKMYHGEKDAEAAFKNFENTFSKGGVPEDVTEVVASRDTLLLDAALSANVVSSKSEWRRLVEEGAVSNMDTGERVTDPNHKATPGTFKIGKRRFIKIK